MAWPTVPKSASRTGVSSRRGSWSARMACIRGRAAKQGCCMNRSPTIRQGVVANFATEFAHRGRAFQWFLADGGVLAWLPLPGKRMSIVWSAPDALARRTADAGTGGAGATRRDGRWTCPRQAGADIRGRWVPALVAQAAVRRVASIRLDRRRGARRSSPCRTGCQPWVRRRGDAVRRYWAVAVRSAMSAHRSCWSVMRGAGRRLSWRCRR